MKILVIGGTGFIGWPLVRRLNDMGHQLVVVSRGRNSVQVPESIEHVIIHRKDVTRFKKIFGKRSFDIIIDIAAFTPRNIIDIADIFPKPTRYILLSSVAVYGKGCGDIVKENSPLKPVPWHDYGYNKIITEQELEKFPHLSWVIVRPSVVYGPRDPHEPRASYFFRRIFHSSPIIIPGFSGMRNNYIYIDDLVELLIYCLDAPKGMILNAAGGEIFDWPHYLQILQEIIGNRTEIRYLQMELEQFREWEYCRLLQFHHNAFYDFIIDTEKAKSLGWQPKCNLRQGLEKTWQWLKQERTHWFQEIDSRLVKEKEWANGYFKETF